MKIIWNYWFTSSESMIFLEKGSNNFLLSCYFNFRSFIDDCAETHSLRLEFENFGHKVFLSLIHQLVSFTVILCFQSHTELKLFVVDKSTWCRPLLRLSYVVHELRATIEIMENNRIKHNFLRSWFNFNHSFSDDSQDSFRSQDELSEIWTTAHTWDILIFSVSSFWSYDLHI